MNRVAKLCCRRRETVEKSLLFSHILSYFLNKSVISIQSDLWVPKSPRMRVGERVSVIRDKVYCVEKNHNTFYFIWWTLTTIEHF